MNLPSVPPLESEEGSIFHKAATAAILLPFLVFVLSPLEKLHFSRTMTLVIGGTVFCVLTLGLIFSIVSLMGISRHGTTKLLGFGLSGICINGLLLVIFITNFTAARLKSKEAHQNVDAIGAEFLTNAANNYNPTSGVDGEKQLKLLSDYQKKLDGMSQQASGDDAAMLKAGQMIIKKIQVASEKMMAADKTCDEVGLFEFGTVTNIGDLKPWRQAVADLKVANIELKSLLTNRANIAAVELRSLHVSEDKIQEFQRGLSRPELEGLTIELRNQVDGYCNTCASLVDLLGTQWGKWHYDTAKETVMFDDASAQRDFRRLALQITTIRKQEVSLQGQILETQKSLRSHP